MSIIQIDKKAVTEEDARAILDATYGLKDPLGIPTLFLRPEQFSPHWLERWPPFLKAALKDTVAVSDKIENEVKHAVDDFLKSGALDQLGRIDGAVSRVHLQAATDKYASAIAQTRLNPHLDRAVTYIQYVDLRKPQHSDSFDYESPLHATIIAPHANVTAYNVIHNMIEGAKGLAQDLPGTNAQFQFNQLWHEIGHGVGADEPQTESIAAVMTRRAINGTAVLEVSADARAVRSIFRHAMDRRDSREMSRIVPEREKYGWPMVEVNDHIATLPEETIATLTEDQIIAMRFQPFDHKGETVKQVADALKAADSRGYRTRDLHTLEQTAQKILKSGALDANGHQILERFQLATHRLTIGIAAYMPAHEDIEAQIERIKTKPPVTFTPGEWIPS